MSDLKLVYNNNNKWSLMIMPWLRVENIMHHYLYGDTFIQNCATEITREGYPQKSQIYSYEYEFQVKGLVNNLKKIENPRTGMK